VTTATFPAIFMRRLRLFFFRTAIELHRQYSIATTKM
jgi:hypothetical protein